MHPTTTIARHRTGAAAASQRKRPRIPAVSTWAAKTLGFHPDPRQRRLLDSTSSRAVVCACRQWGKTTLAAVRALHLATFSPGSLTLIVAPSLRHSAELLGTVRRFQRRPADKSPAIALRNGSRILALPPSPASVRGFSANFVLLDDAAGLHDDIFRTALPTLAATNGRLWVLSSPKSPHGFFHDLWTRRSRDWFRLHAPASLCPRISGLHLRDARLRLGAPAFRQDYLCEFVETGAPLIHPDAIERVFQ